MSMFKNVQEAFEYLSETICTEMCLDKDCIFSACDIHQALNKIDEELTITNSKYIIEKFKYNVYGEYVKYAIPKNGKVVSGFERAEKFNPEIALQKPLIENQGKLMQRLYDSISETSEGMVFVDVMSRTEFVQFFHGLNEDDILRFFKDSKNVFWNILEINFTLSDFKKWKRGIYNCKIPVIICYGDFLCAFNREVTL